MTVIQKKADNPIAHLTPEDIEQLGVELDAIRQDILDSRGARRRRVHPQDDQDPARASSSGAGRCCCSARSRPPGWSARPACRWPRSSTTWRSATTSSTASGTGCATPRSIRRPGSGTWPRRRAVEAQPQPDPPHVHERRRQGQRPRLRHHARRRGPALDAVPPRPADLVLHQRDVLRVRHRGLRPRPRAVIKKKQTKDPEFQRRRQGGLTKIRKQVTKDYVVHPVLSIPTGSFLSTLAANFTANIVRNLWSHSVILCGHFPEGVETFEKRSIEGETKGEWYVRQMLGSANISGSKALHIMTGNLSHQIEHHLFPDLPSNRYAEIAPKVRALFEKYDLTYCTRPMPQQVYSAWHKVVRLACPTAGWRPPTARTCPSSSRRSGR